MLNDPLPDDKKLTIAERAYQIMKQAILCAEIPEGTFLEEGSFAKKYGIGRTPFREACNRLHQQQLLELVPRHGFRVRGLSVREAIDIFEMRLMLEIASVDLAVARGRAADIDFLAELAVNSPEQQSTSAKDFIEANREFHLAIARIGRNSQLVLMLSNLLERYESLSYAELRNGPEPKYSMQELHQPIVDAVRNRDIAAARKAISHDMWEGRVLSLPEVTPYKEVSMITILARPTETS